MTSVIYQDLGSDSSIIYSKWDVNKSTFLNLFPHLSRDVVRLNEIMYVRQLLKPDAIDGLCL